VHSFGTPLDLEVVAFLRRIGESDSPASHIKSYGVIRVEGDVHRVTVEFIADAEFDADDTPQVSAAQRVELRQQGWLPPERVSALRELADGGWPENVYDAESVGNRVLALIDAAVQAEECPPQPS
jgi:hypothetical protein